jgi:hypothetical protein
MLFFVLARRYPLVGLGLGLAGADGPAGILPVSLPGPARVLRGGWLK